MKKHFTILSITAVFALLTVTSHGAANYVYHAQTGDIQSGGGYTYLSPGTSVTDADTVYIRWKAEYNGWTDLGRLHYRYGDSGGYTAAGSAGPEAASVDSGSGNVGVYLFSQTLEPGTFHYKMEAWHSGGGNTAYANGTSTDIGSATDFTLTVTDDDSAAPTLVGTSGTSDTNGYMRILLNGSDKRTSETGLGTKVFTLTDEELRSLSGANKLAFKFSAYDETSGLQRDSAGTSATNMNYDIGEEVGFLQDIFGTYVSGSSAAGTSPATAPWSVFEHSTAFTKDEVSQLYTNSASGTQGKNRIRLSVPDADSDRASDQKWVTDTQVGYLQVDDDDDTAPAPVTIVSPDSGSYRELHVSIGGTSLTSAGSGTNRTYATTDAALAAVAGGNQLIMRFGAVDADSGLARDVAGPAADNMNLDLGQIISDNYAQYDAGNSSSYAETKNARATNAWTWSSAFSGAQISNLVTSATDGVGTNKLALSIHDADDDRNNDRIIVTNQQYGYLVVNDDDPTPPTLVTMRVDYNGAELSTSGSGTDIIYNITDAQLADVAGKTVKFKFSVWDASGLSRNASGSVVEDMNYDIGTDYTGALSGLKNIFETYAAGDGDNAANPIDAGSAEWSVFVHNDNFTAAEIGHLATESDQGTAGKNAILISAPDNDTDRDGDKAWQIDTQIGFLQVNDDDSAGPSFASATFSGKKLQIDITDGSGVYDPGSGGERLYMVYDDDGNVDDGVDGTIDLSPTGGDTYEADGDLSYGDMDGKLVTYRVYAYDNDAEHASDRAQGIYNGSNLWDLSAPVATAASSIAGSGFTANWNAVTGADDYRLDVGLSPVFGTALEDDFEDGNLTGWTQSTAGRFEASTDSPLAGSASLHHVYNNASASHDQAAFSTDGLDLTAATTTWRFQAKHTYNPSTGNNWGIFLLSDLGAAEMYPSGAADGYVAGVNYSSTGTEDNLQIWKITAGAGSLVFDTGFNWQTGVTTANQAGVEVTRTAAGEWSVKVDADGGFDSLVSQVGSASNTDYTNTAYAGVYYEYSSAQDMKLWIDDFSITQPDMFVAGYSNKTVSGTSSAVSGLSASTTYYYRLRAASDGGALSDDSNVITVETTEAAAETGSIFRFR